MNTQLFSNDWFYGYEDYDGDVKIRFSPNNAEDVFVPKEKMEDVTKAVMRIAAKQLGLPVRYFDSICYWVRFSDMIGLYVEVLILDKDRRNKKFKEDQLKTLFNSDEFMEEVSSMLIEYFLFDMEDAE